MITEKKTRLIRGGRIAAGLILIIMFLSDPAGTAQGAKRGSELCLSTLIPSLFPFMVASGIVIGSGAGTLLGKLFSPAMKLFGLPGECAPALVTGVLCGFPVGAVTLTDLYRRGVISEDDGARLLSFCCYPSVPFLVSAIGRGLFGSRSAGVILTVSVYSSGLICGIGYGIIRRFFSRKGRHSVSERRSSSRSFPAGNVFAEAVESAAGGMISVSSCVIFFSAVTELLCRLGQTAGVSGNCLIFLNAFLELTSGSSSASALGMPAGLIICAAAAGWSGMSVHFQIMNTVSPEISLLPYFISKAVQSLLAPLICGCLTRLFPGELISLPDGAEVFRPFPARSVSDLVLWFACAFFAVSVIILLCKKLDRSDRI